MPGQRAGPGVSKYVQLYIVQCTMPRAQNKAAKKFNYITKTIHFAHLGISNQIKSFYFSFYLTAQHTKWVIGDKYFIGREN